MTKQIRSLFLLPVVVLVLLLAGLNVQAAGTQVTVLLSGEEILFPDNPPYYDEQAGRIYVPVRAVTEYMQAQVAYHPESGTVTIDRGSTSILLTINSTTALVNGVEVQLDAPAYIENGSTYVPLRFVSENLALSVIWDAAALTVSMQPAPQVSDGMTEQELTAVYGEPDRQEISEKGYTWWVYADQGSYRMFGVADGQVVAHYEHNDSWVLDNGLRCGMHMSDCEALLDAAEVTDYDTWKVYSDEEKAVTVYYDAQDRAYAVLDEQAFYSQRCTVTVSVLEGNARLLQDFVNIHRRAAGLSPLQEQEAITRIARSHSLDMAGENFYSHVGSDGRSSSQRLSDEGFEGFYQTQIIAKSYPNAMAAFSALINSAQYRNVITADYAVLGVGVAYNAHSDGLFYYTQIFFAEK